MFTIQLAGFLIAHHHAHWAHLLFSGPLGSRQYAHIIAWARAHGFVFHQ